MNILIPRSIVRPRRAQRSRLLLLGGLTFPWFSGKVDASEFSDVTSTVNLTSGFFMNRFIIELIKFIILYAQRLHHLHPKPMRTPQILLFAMCYTNEKKWLGFGCQRVCYCSTYFLIISSNDLPYKGDIIFCFAKHFFPFNT